MKKDYLKFIIATASILLFSSIDVYAAQNTTNNDVESKNSTIVMSEQNNKENETDLKGEVKNESVTTTENDEENTSDKKGSIDNKTNTSTSDKKESKDNKENPTDNKNTEGKTDTGSTQGTGDNSQNKDPEKEEQQDNTSIDKAKNLAINNVDTGKITSENQQRWYLTYLPKGKTTAYLAYKSDTDMKLNLHLFKFDSKENKLSEVSNSVYSNGQSEQLSYIAEEGYYFIAVNSVSGFNENNKFVIALIYSDAYDEHEADDNINNRVIVPKNQTSISGTIDNNFDVDWSQFTVSEKKPVYISLDNSNDSVSYNLSIYDSNLKLLQTINQNQYATATLPAGVYYLKVSSSNGSDATKPYTVNFIQYDDISTANAITSIPISISDSIDNKLDCNWSYFSLKADVDFEGQISNTSTKGKYKLEFYRYNEDSKKLELVYTLNQNDYKNFTLKSGLYYMKVSSIEGFDPDVKYNINLKEYSPDIKFTKNKFYINGEEIKLRYVKAWDSSVSRERYYLDYDANEKCTIESAKYIGSSYKGVKHGVIVTVSNVLYASWVTYWDDGWQKTFSSEYKEKVNFVVDVDTGKCVIAA